MTAVSVSGKSMPSQLFLQPSFGPALLPDSGPPSPQCAGTRVCPPPPRGGRARPSEQLVEPSPKAGPGTVVTHLPIHEKEQSEAALSVSSEMGFLQPMGLALALT